MGSAGARGRILLFVAIVLETAPARGVETTMQGELALWFGDDDVTHEPESPLKARGASTGERDGYTLAVDAMSSRSSSRERRLGLGFSVTDSNTVGLETSAGLRIAVASDPSGVSNSLGFTDDGSFIQIARGRQKLTLYPLNGDALHAGFSEALAWGGQSGPAGASIYDQFGIVPTASYGVGGDSWDLGLVLKAPNATLAKSTTGLERRAQYGTFAWVSYRPCSRLELDFGPGYFQHGAFSEPGIRGEQLVTTGASSRVQVADGVRESSPPGIFPERTSEPRNERGGVAWAAAFEVGALWLKLRDSDRPGSVAWQKARGAALTARMRLLSTTLAAGLVWRDLMFVTRQGPGPLEPETLPRGNRALGERTLFVSVRQRVLSHWTAGFDGGVFTPAAMVSGGPSPQTLLVRGPAQVTPLEPGRGVGPEFQARISLGALLSDLVMGVVWLQYVRNPNGSPLLGAGGTSGPGMHPTHAFGAGAAMKAQF